jgi:hypothetical protein
MQCLGNTLAEADRDLGRTAMRLGVGKTHRRRVAACAGGLVIVGLATAPWSLGAAGLRSDTLRVEAEARAGLVGRVTLSNPSQEKISVSVTPRSWRQRSDGQLLPNTSRKGLLSAVQAAPKAFSLAAGKSRTVEVNLKRTPSARYLYATLVARGVSTSKKAGLRPSYQIAIALSLHPPAARQRYRLLASRPRVRKRKGGGVLIDTVVRNRGNMVDPPTGTITVTRSKTKHTAKVPARVGVLPNGRVRIPAVAMRGLKTGSYRVSITLQQRSGRAGGKTTASNTFRIVRGGRVTR